MTTAIDTNVLVAILRREPNAGSAATKLDEARTEGGLCISAPVFLELAGAPGSRIELLDAFLKEMQVEVHFDLDEAVWRLAAEGYRRYWERRRRASGGHPKRFVTDFLIGAHAALRAQRLVTQDVAPYRNFFPGLLIETA